MVKLQIKLSKARAIRLEKHLAKEHPITKGKMSIRKWLVTALIVILRKSELIVSSVVRN